MRYNYRDINSHDMRYKIFYIVAALMICVYKGSSNI